LKKVEKVKNWAIRALRAQYNYNQERMGAINGDSVETYSRKERGEQEYTISDAHGFKKHFGLETIDEIFPS